MIGRVNKGIAGKFTVFCRENDTSYLCAAKGKLKKDGEIFIGDIVEFDEKERIITRIFERKNFLVRPPVSNIDLVVIIVAPLPEPDFLLVDKIIINAIDMNVEPIICVNKIDCILENAQKLREINSEKYVKNGSGNIDCTFEDPLKSSETDSEKRVENNGGENDCTAWNSQKFYETDKGNLIQNGGNKVDCAVGNSQKSGETDKGNLIQNGGNKIDCAAWNSQKSGETGLLKRVEDNYGTVAKIIRVSALKNDIGALLDIIEGRTVCLAGQSAVGKTSALNAVLKKEAGKIGSLSEKSGRGKHTTRHNEIFSFRGALLIDTAGFSELNIPLMNPLELTDYYADFIDFARECKYKGCSHTKEDESECAVKRAVRDGKICGERYGRYIELFKKLSDERKKMY